MIYWTGLAQYAVQGQCKGGMSVRPCVRLSVPSIDSGGHMRSWFAAYRLLIDIYSLPQPGRGQ